MCGYPNAEETGQLPLYTRALSISEIGALSRHVESSRLLFTFYRRLKRLSAEARSATPSPN